MGVVITRRVLRTGQTFACEPIALMEQVEDGAVDHNVLAKLPDEEIELTPQMQTILTDFVLSVFGHVAGKQIAVGRFLDARHAAAYIVGASNTGEPE